jgi:hypothetical protein
MSLLASRRAWRSGRYTTCLRLLSATAIETLDTISTSMAVHPTKHFRVFDVGSARDTCVGTVRTAAVCHACHAHGQVVRSSQSERRSARSSVAAEDPQTQHECNALGDDSVLVPFDRWPLLVLSLSIRRSLSTFDHLVKTRPFCMPSLSIQCTCWLNSSLVLRSRALNPSSDRAWLSGTESTFGRALLTFGSCAEVASTDALDSEVRSRQDHAVYVFYRDHLVLLRLVRGGLFVQCDADRCVSALDGPSNNAPVTRRP